MVTTPADTPVTIPVEEPTVALAVLLLLHTPPADASLRVLVWAIHTDDGPLMGAAVVAPIVTNAVTVHPELSE